MLNTRIPPFDDVRVRRALNFAVDRAAAAAAWPSIVTPTCQILPPDLAGLPTLLSLHTAPELPRVLGLTRLPDGRRIWSLHRTPQVCRSPSGRCPILRPAVEAVVRALRDLGYRVTFKVGNPGGDFFAYVADSRHHVQASFFGWISDDLSVEDFIPQLFACGSFSAGNPHNVNTSGFCDPGTDELIRRAEQTRVDVAAGRERRVGEGRPAHHRRVALDPAGQCVVGGRRVPPCAQLRPQSRHWCPLRPDVGRVNSRMRRGSAAHRRQRGEADRCQPIPFLDCSIMADVLEVWSRGRASLVLLEDGRLTIGRGSENDITIADPEASAVHAALEPLAGAWTVRDLTSRNGTFVNGERVLGERPLHRGDEIRIGRSRLVYRPASSTAAIDLTASPHGVPDLTRRERDVLLALFNGRFPDAVFVEPATHARNRDRAARHRCGRQATPGEAVRQVRPHASCRTHPRPARQRGSPTRRRSASRTFTARSPKTDDRRKDSDATRTACSLDLVFVALVLPAMCLDGGLCSERSASLRPGTLDVTAVPKPARG